MQIEEPSASRILIYSHDSFGLGHLRRSLTLAEAIVEALPEASVLLVTGSPCATFFACPPGVDFVKLPCVTKDENGEYVSRSLRGSFHAVLRLRRSILLESFRSFAPDLVVVDHQVTGMRGEMLPILREAREAGVKTVLGIRDIIDEPDVVAREWGTADCRWALAQGYDRVCVYGAPEVYDPREKYPFPPELAARVEFTGYVVRKRGRYGKRTLPTGKPQVLVTMGGGEDGAARIDTYLESLETGEVSYESTIVSGPLLDAPEARRLREKARATKGVHIHRSYGDLPKLFAEATGIVSMAGYNTCAEILASGTPTVLMPRTRPRREQAIRASRLEHLGLARSLVDPTPRELRMAVEAMISGDITRPKCPDLRGAERVCQILSSLLSPGTRSFRRLVCDDERSMVS